MKELFLEVGKTALFMLVILGGLLAVTITLSIIAGVLIHGLP